MAARAHGSAAARQGRAHGRRRPDRERSRSRRDRRLEPRRPPGRRLRRLTGRARRGARRDRPGRDGADGRRHPPRRRRAEGAGVGRRRRAPRSPLRLRAGGRRRGRRRGRDPAARRRDRPDAGARRRALRPTSRSHRWSLPPRRIRVVSVDLRDTPEEAAFRAELRAWIETNLTDQIRRGRFEEAGPGLEPEAARGRLRGPDLAEGVRRRRRALQPPGDLPRGDGARRGAAPPRRDRARDGRADDHRPRHRRPEAEAPGEDPLDRGDLVPGLLRAGRGLRPLRRAHDRPPRERPLRRRRPEGLVVVRAHRRLVHPRHAQRPRRASAMPA